MAIIAENEYGWFICCKTYFDAIYKLCEVSSSSFRAFALKNAFFQINNPFLMNSQTLKYSKGLSASEKYKKKKISKLKKIISVATPCDDEKEAFIKNGTNLLVTVAKDFHFLEDTKVTAEEWLDNNSIARKAAMEVLDNSNPSNSLGSVCSNSSSFSIVKSIGNDEYLLPPQSSFHLCDIADFFQLVAEKYDLIVIDPPWINKSVKRKSSYYQLKYDSLRNLPIEDIVKPGCLIAIWITNSPSTSSFVMNELFPKCNVICSAMWHWCKVTKKGTFVCPIESQHKKPYENLILGRVAYNCDKRPSKEIDTKKLIICIPSSIHSHKPPLVEILKPFLMPDAHCLELFARNLLPGWKSVGNEVLKLQNIKLFDQVE